MLWFPSLRTSVLNFELNLRACSKTKLMRWNIIGTICAGIVVKQDMFVPSVLILAITLPLIIVNVDFPTLHYALLANYLLGDHTDLHYHCVRHLCLLSLSVSAQVDGGV